MNSLPLAAAWIRGSRDTVRDEMLATLREGLESYADQASERYDWLPLALLRRKRLVRFRDREPTFTGWSEREHLTLAGHSRSAVAWGSLNSGLLSSSGEISRARTRTYLGL
jgi:hypothetical protein